MATTKQLGTIIRKEELKRQALTASVNKPIAENILQTIEGKLTMIPNLRKEIREAAAKALKEGKPVLETAIIKFTEGMIEAFPWVITGGIDELKILVGEVNQQVEVANRILEEINKAGIFTPRLGNISYKENDPISLRQALETANDRLKTIIDFYHGLEEASHN